MKREYHRWYSPSLGRDMELLEYGHAGHPWVVFPTSMGRFYEFEDRGMVGTLAERIERGWLRLYCVDSVDAESWYNRSAHPDVRLARHAQYEEYVMHEVLPLAHGVEPGNGRAGVMGCSLGAFHAVLLAFRNPGAFDRVLAMSGKYDNASFLDGCTTTEAYLTNPLAFLRELRDPAYLEPMRAMGITIVSGATDPHIHEARDLSDVLHGIGVPNTLHVWDGWVHDWPYWHSMVNQYI